MTYSLLYLEGRLYRYSDERRVSGRPASIQYQNARNEWRDVRNVDMSDRIWREADNWKPDTIGEYLLKGLVY